MMAAGWRILVPARSGTLAWQGGWRGAAPKGPSLIVVALVPWR